MTATLKLRLELQDEASLGDVVANVYGLDDAGHRLHQNDRRAIVIPTGRNASARTVQVAPGNYIIEAMLPSGDVASDQVTVSEGDEHEVALEAPDSPSGWLSWQKLIGNVPAKSDLASDEARTSQVSDLTAEGPLTQVERIEAFIREVKLTEARERSEDLDVGTKSPKRKSSHGGIPRRITFTIPGRRTVTSPSPRPQRSKSTPKGERPDAAGAPWPDVWFIRYPARSLAGEGTAKGAWDILGGPPPPSKTLSAISRKAPHRANPQFEHERWRRYAFGGDGDLRPGEGDTAGGDTLPRRYVVAVGARGEIELASLPVPWQSSGYRQVPVELLVRREPRPGEAILALSPEDPDLRSALGYLGAGSLTNARVIFDQARHMLFGKRINALGAAAGGYVVLATDVGVGDREWHHWIRNLAEWFEFMPDGMIQYGRLRLTQRQGEADIKEARRAFFAAFDRGIPFYSLGLQWLVDGLSLLATRNDKEARRRLAAVQRVTWRANLQQPFTTIRLHQK